MIFHIAEKPVWVACQALDSYVPNEYLKEGFVHCSKLSQVENTANNYYRGRTDLVLLQIDPEKLHCATRYENLNGGEEDFPHVYGEIDRSAIMKVIDLKWTEENQLIGLGDFN